MSKIYTGPECAALIRNALNESVANGASPEIKLLKLVAELEGKARAAAADGVSHEPPAGVATDSDPEHVLVASGGSGGDAVVSDVPVTDKTKKK